jgi:hypothetical protein
MNEVMSTGELFERGWAKYDLARRVRDQDLARVRRGAYAEPLPPDASAENRHRQLIAAALPGLHPGAVVSHGSAAVVHALSVWRGALDRVHVTRSIASGGHRRRLVHVHAAPLRDSDVVRVNGVAVTSIARTVLDLARTVPFQQAVSAGDRALALGLDPEALRNGLARMRSWPGVRAAQRSCGFMDPRSESVGESFSRVRFLEQGIPAPELQYEVYDENGFLLARCDFGWEEQRTLGEFDGKVKYDRLLRPGQTGGDAVYAEKMREDALRDRGWQVVRWTWADLERPEVIRDRLLRAFERTAGLAPSARAAVNREVRRLR